LLTIFVILFILDSGKSCIFNRILTIIYGTIFAIYIFKMFAEKRISRRYPLTGVAQIRAAVSSDDVLTSCLVQNVSEAGIGLYSYTAIETGTPVHITIILTSRDGIRVSDSIEGAIVSIREESEYFYLGIAFDKKISNADQPHLYEKLKLIKEL
jgi:hypothetical protein